jgi:hypothetical protein
MKRYLDGRLGFLKQTLLIAAPLAVLSGIALYSLRQDRASLAPAARDRAQMLAPELARLWLAVGLILSATAAAGIGLASAWRAFQRQL